MFGYIEADRCLGSRRRGGPVPVKGVMAAVLAGLQEASLANTAHTFFAPVLAEARGAQSAEAASAFSVAA